MDRLQINPNVIHDRIEGEIILLNLDTGTYYQLKNEAVSIWQDITLGAPVPVLESNFAARYGLSNQKATETIQPFLLELQAEDIVRVTLADEPPAGQLPAPNPVATEFKPPVLLKFTDMQSLLLLDPIHDVDTEGWPLKRNDTDA